jgi:hypothetical protein
LSDKKFHQYEVELSAASVGSRVLAVICRNQMSELFRRCVTTGMLLAYFSTSLEGPRQEAAFDWSHRGISDEEAG